MSPSKPQVGISTVGSQKDRARFAKHNIPEPNSGCHLWMAGLSTGGYGSFKYRGKTVKANRMAWEFANGPIPTNLHALHTCDVPSCVNPDHLYLGTDADNAADRSRRGRHWAQRRTHCEHGHALTPENTPSIGVRYCRECKRLNTAAWRQRRAA